MRTKKRKAITKAQTKVFLKPEYIMAKEDIDFLNGLPDNMPDTKLTEKQKLHVGHLYHKYLGKIDNLDWSIPMVEMEMKEKWPSGPRMKREQAQRICLNFLVTEQPLNGMSLRRAAWHFLTGIRHRDSARRIVVNVWDFEPVY